MKRDMDLVRLILLETEKRSCKEIDKPLTIAGHTAEDIAYHVKLLRDEGLIEAEDWSTMDGTGQGMDWRPICLTWEGHDFVDACRDDSRWNEAKRIAKEKGGTVTFQVLKEVLVALLKKAVGL